MVSETIVDGDHVEMSIELKGGRLSLSKDEYGRKQKLKMAWLGLAGIEAVISPINEGSRLTR